MLFTTFQRRMEQRRIERKKREDLQAASGLDISSVRTICLALGPYRSFTTITASFIARHPECQAINHGGKQILGDPRLDFLGCYRPGTADRFVRYGLHVSRNGTHAKHAGAGPRPASHHDPRARPRAFFWNDPLRTSQHLRRHNVDMATLLENEPRLRFLQTIRNPIDCAYSIGKNGLAPRMGLERSASMEAILDRVLAEISWFTAFSEEHPERFFSFFTDTFDSGKARQLAGFLQVEPLENWARRSNGCFDYPRTLSIGGKLRKHYNDSVERRFEAFPEAREQLLALLDG